MRITALALRDGDRDKIGLADKVLNGVGADGDRGGGPATRSQAWPAWSICLAQAAAGIGSQPDRVGHLATTTSQTWCHTLEFTAAGQALGDQFLGGGQGVARIPGAALAGGEVQVLHRLELVAKVTDVVGLYLDPPENAIVLESQPLTDFKHGPAVRLRL